MLGAGGRGGRGGRGGSFIKRKEKGRGQGGRGTKDKKKNGTTLKSLKLSFPRLVPMNLRENQTYTKCHLCPSFPKGGT